MKTTFFCPTCGEPLLFEEETNVFETDAGVQCGWVYCQDTQCVYSMGCCVINGEYHFDDGNDPRKSTEEA